MHLNIRSSAQVLALYLCHTEGSLSAPQSHSRCDIWPNCQVSEMPQLILDFKIAWYILVLLPTKKINLALRDAVINNYKKKSLSCSIQHINIDKHRHLYTIWCSSIYNISSITQQWDFKYTQTPPYIYYLVFIYVQYFLHYSIINDYSYNRQLVYKFIMRLGNSKFTIMKQKSAL